jgi:hemoglobin/transferrin/lactoferrin receptor protein
MPEDSLLQIPSEYEQLNLMQKVHFKPNETWDFNYGFHHSETSPYGRYDRHNRVQNNLPRYAEWSYGPQVWKMHNLNIAYTKKTKWFDHATMRLAYQRFEESRISRDLYSDTRTIKSEEVDAYSANFDLLKALNTKNSLFYGFEYVFNDVFSKGETLDMNTAVYSDAESRYPKAQWSSLAAYVNHAYKASELLTFQSGLRFNQYQLDATFDTTYYPFPFTTANLKKAALTGSIGATYRPSESWLLSSNFGTAFRSPNVDDMGKLFDSGNGIVVVPNPELKAEYAYNGDIGAAKVFGDVLKLDVSAYFTFLDNAMVRRDFTLNGQDSIIYDGSLSQVQAVQNAAKAKVFGIQAGLELKLPKGFKFSSDFNFQKGEEELANGNISPTRHATPAFGTTRLNYKAQKISLQLNVQYQAERSSEDMPAEEQSKTEIYALDGNGLAYAPSWYTLNFKGMYQVTSYLSITAGVENITSQRYRPYSSGISGAGRNFVMALRATF